MKTTLEFNSQPHIRSGLTVLATAIIMALAGCSGNGHLNTAGSGGGSTPTGPGGAGGGGSTSSSPVAAVVQETGNTVSDAGQMVGSLGGTVQQVTTPVVGSASGSALGNVVQNAGGTVDSLGAAVSNGLGRIGSTDNPLGVTVSGTGSAVDGLGRTVSSAGDAITGLGSNPATSALRPLTNVGGAVVDRVGEAVSHAGNALESHALSGPLGRTLDGTSNVLERVIEAGVNTTQSVGATTGLGAPVANGVIAPIARTLGEAGEQLSGAAGSTPGAQGLGEILGNTSRTLTGVGMAVNAPSDNPPTSPVEQVGHVVNTLIVPITAPITQTVGGVGDVTGIGNPLGNLLVGTGAAVQHLGTGVAGNTSAPLAGAVGGVVQQTGGLVSSVGVAVGGTSSPAPSTGALAPVVNVVQAVTGGGGSGSGGTAPLANTLGTVTNTVGGLLGTLGR
ncbi:collagen-like triple helix repeat-containing protein [Hydrogenophaga laconesensis]|uniref:Bacterial collagen-like protein middle domain-containing protein n=1 Tax=Hydrogenophaga laconesensis TaxID=1805971 RepID=A0ABU1VDA8_9BURK|nr:collagen-like triple helix repeat-containing protein [Hydrogenophaga laconesensis]MDR7095444.1 hypothetical protein [Hydrogenophaga laconesensis]